MCIIRVQGTAPLLAATLPDRAVHLFNGRGVDLTAAQGGSIRSAAQLVSPVVLAWHPARLLLAVAWHDGSLTFTSIVRDTGKRHYQKATRPTQEGQPVLLQWLDGSRVLLGHASGRCTLWEMQQASDLEVDWEPAQVRLACYTLQASATVKATT